MHRKRIVCFHLYNDFSGSPHILSLILEGLIAKGYKVDLYTSNTEGFLSNIPNVKYHLFYYRWTRNKFRTILLMLYAQTYMFFAALKYVGRKDIIFYLNTICPFGAAIGGSIIKKKVVYHLHEKYIDNNILRKIYYSVYKRNASMTFYVSRYLINEYSNEDKYNIIIYNALSVDFAKKITPILNKQKRVLMIASLKKYKGVYVFVELAKRLPQYSFELIVSATQDEINYSFHDLHAIKNLRIFDTQTDVHPFLSRAGIVLNLSLPNLCIESFGLTILEAMSYGIPTICPPVGGPTELVTDSYNGYLVDSRDIELLREKIISIFEFDDYKQMSLNAIRKSQEFSYTKMINEVEINIRKLL